jgi:uncharacterized membrane protein
MSVLLTGLLTALDAVYLLPVNRSYKALSRAEYARAHRSVVRVAGPTAPLLAAPLLVMDAVLLLKMRRLADKAFAWTAFSLVFTLVNAAITFAVNVPINRKFTDAPEHSAPEDWKRLRDRWAVAHNIRTTAQLLGFASLIVGLIRRQPEGD